MTSPAQEWITKGSEKEVNPINPNRPMVKRRGCDEMKTILVLLAVVLASCTPSYSTFVTHPDRWTKPDYDFQRFANDENICRQQAESLPSIFPKGRDVDSGWFWITPVPITSTENRKRRDLYKQCMESKGYVWK